MSEKRPVRNAQSRVRNNVLGSISGPRICLKDFLQSRLGHHLMSRHHCGDRFSNAKIAELPLTKCLHRHFISCIEDGRQCPAFIAGPSGEGQAGKRPTSGSSKSNRPISAKLVWTRSLAAAQDMSTRIGSADTYRAWRVVRASSRRQIPPWNESRSVDAQPP